jgi:hypothetical protein
VTPGRFRSPIDSAERTGCEPTLVAVHWLRQGDDQGRRGWGLFLIGPFSFGHPVHALLDGIRSNRACARVALHPGGSFIFLPKCSREITSTAKANLTGGLVPHVGLWREPDIQQEYVKLSLGQGRHITPEILEVRKGLDEVAIAGRTSVAARTEKRPPEESPNTALANSPSTDGNNTQRGVD